LEEDRPVQPQGEEPGHGQPLVGEVTHIGQGDREGRRIGASGQVVCWHWSTLCARWPLDYQWDVSPVFPRGRDNVYARSHARARPPPQPRETGRVTVLDDVRADIAALGTLTIRDPAPETDPHCPAWEAVGDPLLGVLAVARDWLTLDQVIRLAGVTVWRRDVATVIARVRRQLDSAGPRLRLTRAFRDELAADPAIAAAGHARIALAYRAGAAGWAEIDWSRIDRYGLRHLATHVARAGRPLADGVVDLVTPELHQALI